MEKETIELVKKMIEDGNLSQEIAEKYCPELKESEDEKIRKAILNYFTKCWGNCKDDVCGIHVEDAIAWLEKQKRLTTEEYDQGKSDVQWCIDQAKKHAKDENEMGTCWFAEKWLEKQGKSQKRI